MPKCPSCGAEITYLSFNTTKRYYGVFYILDGLACTENVVFTEDETSYTCPECEKELATSGDTAKSFLMGEA